MKEKGEKRRVEEKERDETEKRREKEINGVQWPVISFKVFIFSFQIIWSETFMHFMDQLLAKKDMELLTFQPLSLAFCERNKPISVESKCFFVCLCIYITYTHIFAPR